MATSSLPQHLVVAANPVRYANKLRFNRESAKRRRAKNRAYDNARDRQKVRARKFILNLVHRGKLQRQPCVVCGGEDTHAHHEDYQKKNEIAWLCPKDHAAVHKGLIKLTPTQITVLSLRRTRA